MGVYEILLNNYSWPTPVLKQHLSFIKIKWSPTNPIWHLQVMIRFWWFICFVSEFSRSANTFSFSMLLLNSCQNFYQQPPNCSSVKQQPTSVC